MDKQTDYTNERVRSGRAGGVLGPQSQFFLILPNFNLDKGNITPKNIWMHFFKELGTMDRIDPSVYERADEGLLRLLEKAKTAALTEEEYALYEASMKILENEVDMEEHGYRRGMEDGVEQESLRYEKEMKEKGVAMEIIMEISHLSQEEILAL